MSDKFNQRAPTETDPRFVSGQWRGYWLQHGRRGEMQLHLEFRAGRVTGVGRDPIGSFNVSGTYDVTSGRTMFVKGYFRAHLIDYKGWAEVCGTGIWGGWSLKNQTHRGGWHIWPNESGNDRVSTAQERAPDRIIKWNPQEVGPTLYTLTPSKSKARSAQDSLMRLWTGFQEGRQIITLR